MLHAIFNPELGGASTVHHERKNRESEGNISKSVLQLGSDTCHNSLARPGLVVQPNGKRLQSASLPCSQKADSRRYFVSSIHGNHKMPYWLGNNIFFCCSTLSFLDIQAWIFSLFYYLDKTPEISVIQSIKKRVIQLVNPESKTKPNAT